MNAWTELTPGGQTRRLRRLALAALEHYDLAVTALRPLAVETNVLFLVHTVTGPYVLRINAPQQRTLLEIQSELLWLTALQHQTTLSVPNPLRSRSCAMVVTVQVDGVPERRHCALFPWLPGRTIGEQLSPAIVGQMGAVLAQLHNHADTFAPPARFSTTRWDTAWTFGRPTMADGAGAPARWPAPRQQLVEDTAARVQRAFDQLYTEPQALRFLHGDYHPHNLKRHHGAITVLDFDDSRWMYPVQDMGLALFYLVDEPNYRQLRTSFLEGYSSVRPSALPHADEIDLCIAARQIDLISYVLHFNILPAAAVPAWLTRVEQRLSTIMGTA